MKRDIKINVDHLDGMTKKLAAYLGVAAKIRLASERYMEIMLDQESDAYHNLAEEWRVMVVNRAQLLQQNITDAYRLLERYISSMGYYIGPKDSSKMMRVDRNDIWWNLEQAKWHLKDLSDIHDDYYQSYANYKHYFWEEILHSEEEWKTIKAIERREKEYRESNYDKMQEMKRKLSEDIEEHLKKVHWKLYNENIKPFENEDDAFADEADKFYDKIKTFADGAQDVATAIVRVGKGAGDALLGTLDGIYTIGLACSPTVWIMNHYGLLDEKTEQRVDNFTGGIEQLFTDPVNTLEAMGQSCMDTYDEEGLAYAVGNVGFEVVFELALTKGMGKVLDTMDDVTDAAKTVGKLDEVVDSVDDVHYKTDTVEEMYDEIFEQQRTVNQSYEDYLDDLQELQKDVDVVGEGGLDPIQIGRTDLDVLRKKLGVPETDTIAVGKTDVRGLEGVTFEGQSPKVRSEAGLPDLDEIWAGRNIKSPGNNPLFTRHAEEILANDFDRAVIEAGINPQDVSGVLKIHQSNPTGVCRKCIQGLSNDNVSPGVLKQLSLKYPNLRIEVTSEILPDVKVTGKSKFIIQNGQYVE